MAEILKSVLAKLASETMNRYVRSQGIHSELKKWERVLVQIQCVLNDASQKEINDKAVKRWLDDLQHLTYDIDDILDDLATEAMHHEFIEKYGAITAKVIKLITTCCTNIGLDNRMHHKLDNIITSLQELDNEKSRIGLIVNNERPTNTNRKLQTSLVDVPSIVGRQGEKEALICKLLGGESSDKNFSVVPIVGMGGVGKTTLARLLYDEKQVNDHFELMAWVCVSDNFDCLAISKVIFQSVTGENKDFEDLNLLQVALRDQLRGKRFLLVLDDVWSESHQDWETLVAPFHTCASGSKIVMTTRKEPLLNKLGYNKLNHLKSLSHDDALCLFAQHALGVKSFDSHPTLKSHGEGIVKKCDGLPLALIALGRLLRTKEDEEEYWEKVLNSEIWGLQDGGEILPALRLSYHDLSAHLKQLFAYCSLFPKNYVFDKKDLVLLWMAEGFLHQSSPSNSTTERERLGHEYFDELWSRSFFRHAPNNESLFVMHDLMNDLATFVAGDFFLRIDNDVKKETLENYRHTSFVREEYEPCKRFEAFKRAKNVRTFLAASAREEKEWYQTFYYLSNKILIDLLPVLPLLRVLSLSGYEISEVPESIGSLKHLRYLNLSLTKIIHLPENVGNLYNLQTLILFGCHDLVKLPNSFIKLKKLRHFDVRDTPSLNKMPSSLGELKSLQTLSKIIIGDDNGFKITELKGLMNLCGKFSIKGLDKVKNEIHAREMKISQKGFSELELEWSADFASSRKETLEMKVLNELKPCKDRLKQLEIVSYGGRKFPDWVGDKSFLHLKHVSIRGCKNCMSLPPLGQLPSLKELFIEGLDGVKSVGSELLGSSVKFPSLEILSFKDMQGWEKWLTNSGDAFPRLEKLYICKCHSLDEISVGKVPSLRVLEVTACRNGVLRSLVPIASSVKELKLESITGLTDEVWGGVIEYLGEVEELIIEKCNEIRYIWESQPSTVLKNLRKLKVENCSNFVSLGEKKEGEDSSGMTSLRVMECYRCPDSIETLSIIYCNSMTAISFPEGGGQKLKSLNISQCSNLSEEEFMGGERSTSASVLEDIEINGWLNLKSIIELNRYTHLIKLTINSCQSLESFPYQEFYQLKSLNQLILSNCRNMDDSFLNSEVVWPPKLQTLVIGGFKNPMLKWGSCNFPSTILNLALYDGGLTNVIDFSQLSHLLPSSLKSLTIWSFKKLETVSTGLQHLTSLQHLQICWCPEVIHLPEMLLPSLLSLGIIDSPKLKERCSKSKIGFYYWPIISHIGCYYWPRISHIPNITVKDGTNEKIRLSF